MSVNQKSIVKNFKNSKMEENGHFAKKNCENPSQKIAKMEEYGQNESPTLEDDFDY